MTPSPDWWAKVVEDRDRTNEEIKMQVFDPILKGTFAELMVTGGLTVEREMTREELREKYPEPEKQK